MYIITDEVMDKLLGGNFFIILDFAKRNKQASIKDLFCFQFKYNSYNGFRRFYNNKLKHLIGNIGYINENGFIGKLIKRIGIG